MKRFKKLIFYALALGCSAQTTGLAASEFCEAVWDREYKKCLSKFPAPTVKDSTNCDWEARKAADIPPEKCDQASKRKKK